MFLRIFNILFIHLIYLEVRERNICWFTTQIPSLGPKTELVIQSKSPSWGTGTQQLEPAPTESQGSISTRLELGVKLGLKLWHELNSHWDKCLSLMLLSFLWFYPTEFVWPRYLSSTNSLCLLSRSFQKQRPWRIKPQWEEAKSHRISYGLLTWFPYQILTSLRPWGGAVDLMAELGFMAEWQRQSLILRTRSQATPSTGPTPVSYRVDSTSQWTPPPSLPLPPPPWSEFAGFIGLSQRHTISVTAEWQL